MKRVIFVLLVLVCLAPSYIDQTDANFNLGNTSNTNVTNNSVILANISGNYSLSGTYLSRVFDLGSNPNASISWTAVGPSGTSVLVSSRSGPDATVTGDWTSYTGSYGDSDGSAVTAARNRYHQYRLQLATTNGSDTPAVRIVTLTYTEAGPEVGVHQSQANLTDETNNFRIRIDINDTANITAANARYRINSTGTYNAYQALTNASTYWYLDVTEPTNGWGNSTNGTLYYNVYITNDAGDTVNTTFTEAIEGVNDAPVINQLSNNTGTEGTLMTRTVTGTDPDGDTITWSISTGSITKVSNTQASISWTPSNDENGLVNVTVTMSDGSLSDTMTWTSNITGTNNAPVISSITDQEGYYGDRITFTVTVNDADVTDNLTWWVRPAHFTITATNQSGGNSSTQYGLANFTALDDHRGTRDYTITVSDGTALDRENVTISIGYCGDNVCTTGSETADTCSADCASDTPIGYVAIDVPDRICVNQSNLIQTFNASARYACYYEGQTAASNAYCELHGGVEIQPFLIENSQRTELSTFSTSSEGNVSWTPTQLGETKLVGTAEELLSASRIVTVQRCDEDINASDRLIEYQRPRIEADPLPPAIPAPEEQEPAGVPEETSLIAIFIWYVLVPLLLASLLYIGNIYYDINKDADPYILKARLKFWEIRNIVEPKLIEAYKPVKPYLDPAVTLIRDHVIAPIKWLGEETMQALRRMRKK